MQERFVNIGAGLLLIGYFLITGTFTPPPDFNDPFSVWCIRIGLYALGIGALFLLFQQRRKKKRDAEKASSLYLMQYGHNILVTPGDILLEAIRSEPPVYCLLFENRAGKRYVSREIQMDREAILTRIAKQTEIHIYEDTVHPKNYFFDVDFLKE